MLWEIIKASGIAGFILVPFMYAYSRIPAFLFVAAALLLIIGLMNCIEVIR
ncbi:MAG: hypothetical protein QME12_03735 [Nanoarchaeota archaeon]|nr:hypothetical protein [Nanoarchaeota archaeon]